LLLAIDEQAKTHLDFVTHPGKGTEIVVCIPVQTIVEES
jgi:hypothetical protein